MQHQTRDNVNLKERPRKKNITKHNWYNTYLTFCFSVLYAFLIPILPVWIYLSLLLKKRKSISLKTTKTHSITTNFTSTHKDPNKTKQPTNQTYKQPKWNEMNSFIESTKQPISLTNPYEKNTNKQWLKKESQVQSKTVTRKRTHTVQNSYTHDWEPIQIFWCQFTNKSILNREKKKSKDYLDLHCST